MKILGISCGTKNGNNDAICKEVLMAAAEQGAEVSFINVWDLNIQHCTGCTACVMSLMSGKGGKCVIKDDFDWLRDKIFEADGLIWAVPIFEKGAAGIFRTITDRFGPRNDVGMNIIGTQIAEQIPGGVAPDQRLMKPRVASFIGVGGSDWSTRIQCDFLNLALTPMFKVIETEVFSWSKCIVMEDEKIARAHEIGVNLAKAAGDIENASYVGDPGICPHCHCRNFFLADDATQAICCACGLVGEIKVIDGKLRFSFNPGTEHHAHDTLSGKFIHCDDIKENEGKLMELKKTDEFKARKAKYNEFITGMKPER